MSDDLTGAVSSMASDESPPETTEAVESTEATESVESSAPTSGFGGMVEGLPADLRDHPSMSDINDFEALAKSYVHSQSMLGRDRIEAPNDKWEDSDWGKFYDSLGRPEAPDGYSLAKNEAFNAVDPNNVLRDSLLPAMHNAGLSEAQANDLASAWVNMTQVGTQQLQENQAKQLSQTQADLKEEWGNAYEARLEAANEAATEIFGTDLETFRTQKLDDGTYLGDNGFVVRMLAHLGDSIGEGALPRGNSRATLTPDEAQSELRSIESDSEMYEAWMNRDHPRHQEVLKRRMQLREMAEGQNNQSRDLFAPQL